VAPFDSRRPSVDHDTLGMTSPILETRCPFNAQHIIDRKRVTPLGSHIVEVHLPFDRQLVGILPAASMPRSDLAVAATPFVDGPFDTAKR